MCTEMASMRPQVRGGNVVGSRMQASFDEAKDNIGA